MKMIIGANAFATSEKENIPAAFALKAAGISHFHGFLFSLFLFFLFFCPVLFLLFALHNFFAEQFVAAAFLREEGGTRKRDGRSKRNRKSAHFSFFAEQPDTDRLPSFKRGELSPQATEGC